MSCPACPRRAFSWMLILLEADPKSDPMVGPLQIQISSFHQRPGTQRPGVLGVLWYTGRCIGSHTTDSQMQDGRDGVPKRRSNVTAVDSTPSISCFSGQYSHLIGTRRTTQHFIWWLGPQFASSHSALPCLGFSNCATSGVSPDGNWMMV